MNRSKRYQQLAEKIDQNKTYTPEEAIKLAKETASTKFDGSVEVHIRTGIDPIKSDQQVRGSITLPAGTGKTEKIAAFVSQDKQKEAKDAGADVVYDEEDIKKIGQSGKIEFEVAIATPDMMPKLAAIAKILGPRGLMPSPKTGTITNDIKKTVEELKKGKINFKNDNTSNIHQNIGKTSFTEQQLIDNYTAFMDAVIKAKPTSAKGVYIKSISISTTMGPGIKVAA